MDDSSKDGLEGVARSSSTSSPTPSSGAVPFYSIGYYKSYFDISTDTLFSRMGRALNPASAPFYADEAAAPPDLYGPFWITSTLVLLIAVCANLGSYIDYYYVESDASTEEGSVPVAREPWKYNFSNLSVATSVLYSLISWVPVVLYFLLSRSGQAKGLVEVVSMMGYSFTPLLFVTLLLVIPSPILRWVVVAVGCVLQSWFLVKNLWTDRSNSKVMPVVILAVAICLGLALLYRWSAAHTQQLSHLLSAALSSADLCSDCFICYNAGTSSLSECETARHEGSDCEPMPL